MKLTVVKTERMCKKMMDGQISVAKNERVTEEPVNKPCQKNKFFMEGFLSLFMQKVPPSTQYSFYAAHGIR